jgi:hypothetical protein
MRTLKSTLTGQEFITVGKRKNGTVALMSDDNQITWFDADLLKYFTEV